jgi:hypothetical protein
LICYTIGFAAFASQPLFEDSGAPPLSAEVIRDNFDCGLRWLLAGTATRVNSVQDDPPATPYAGSRER